MKKPENKPVLRDANLDLLRILSMLLIIFLHSIDHSGVLEAAADSSAPMRFYVQFTYALCQVCVNCYVLLSGYYLVTSRFRVRKLIVLWMETVFYSLVIRLVFIGAGLRSFSVGSIVSCFVPILTGRYWFVTIYVGLYLVSPFLNMAIRAMNRRQHGALNLVLFLIMSLWSSIHPAIAGMNSGGGWGLAWFVVLYLLAAWFRLYSEPSQKPYGYLAGFLLIPLLMAAVRMLGEKVSLVGSIAGNWYRYDSAPVYLMTLCLFVSFLNIRIIGNAVSRLICGIAPLTFGVYLIHAHADASPWLWEAAALPEKMGSPLFPLIQLGLVLGIFAVCILIDFLRKNTVGRLETCKPVNMISEKISSVLKLN